VSEQSATILKIANQLCKKLSTYSSFTDSENIELFLKLVPFLISYADSCGTVERGEICQGLGDVITSFRWSAFGVNLLEAIAPADAPQRSPARATLLGKILGKAEIAEAFALDRLQPSDLKHPTNLLPLLHSILRQELRSSALNPDTIVNSLRLIKAIGPCDAATDLTPEIATLAGVPVFSVGRAIGSLLGSRFFRVPWGRKREIPNNVQLAARETLRTLQVNHLCGPGII